MRLIDADNLKKKYKEYAPHVQVDHITRMIDEADTIPVIDKVLEIIDRLETEENRLEERANGMDYHVTTPTGSVKEVENLVTPRNPTEIKVARLNAKADGIQYAREYLRAAIQALKGGDG